MHVRLFPMEYYSWLNTLSSTIPLKILVLLRSYFDDLAVGVLKRCHDKDQCKARQLLTRKMSHFCDKTMLELAVHADSKQFVEHPACQTLLDQIWRGKLSLDTGKLKVSTEGTRDVLIYIIIR